MSRSVNSEFLESHPLTEEDLQKIFRIPKAMEPTIYVSPHSPIWLEHIKRKEAKRKKKIRSFKRKYNNVK